MINPKDIALHFLPPLVAALCLLPAAEVCAAAPAGDAQAQARAILAAPRSEAAPGEERSPVRVLGRAGDAALAARSLLLGDVAPQVRRMDALTLQARLALRTGRAARQDAQAQARRLIHGGAA